MKEIKNNKIFITGGCGFIGHHIVNSLKEDNKIIIYDNLRRNAIQYSNLLKHKNVKFIKGDILDKKKLNKSIGDSNIVIHLAAMAGVTSYYYYPKKTIEVNIVGFYNLLETLTDKKIDLLISFSTSEVYGPMVFKSSEEEFTSQGPAGDYRWTYAVSKLSDEHMLFAYQRELDIPFVVLRPFNIYGPGQVGEGAITIFIDRVMKNKPIKVTGDGTQIRAWCYVSDMVTATLNAIKYKSRVKNNVFNIGNPEETITILNLARLINRLLKSSIKIKFIKHPGTDIDLRIPNIKKSAKLLKYKPKINLEQGLLKTIEWYKKYKPLIKEV